MTKSNAKSAAKKSVAKSTPKPTAKKPAAKATKPVADAKMKAANDVQPETIAAAVAVKPEMAKVALNQKATLKPEVVTALEAQAEKDSPKVVAEIGPKPEKTSRPTLAPKIRRKGDILNALKKDGLLYLDKGLYRLDVDGVVHPVSKRRASALVKTDLVKPVAAGLAKGFINAWQIAPTAPKGPKSEKK